MIYSVQRVELGTWWNYKQISSPFTRLYYVLKGKDTWVEHHEKRFDMTEGELLIIPPFTLADYVCNAHCELYSIHFTAECYQGVELFLLNEMRWRHKELGILPELFERINQLNPKRSMEIVDPDNEAYNQSIRSLFGIETELNKEMESNAIMHLLLSRFVPDSIRAVPNTTAREQKIMQTLSYINNHLNEPLTLDVLARQANLNPTYLSNTFEEVLSIRPTKYIQGKRIEKAQLLLLSTNQSLKEIAYQIGIPNTDYFLRMFKIKVGMTPSEYRNKGMQMA
ncbi:helix-turn-helix transcriptional regulator [Coraliomargarita akajimensis]|nr:AraC family transcriptional regulator [Coraliomargarita akajimensis]